MQYSVQRETMRGIADAVRGLAYTDAQMTPDEIIDEINEHTLGIPLSPDICGKMANGKWVRPADWPDIAALFEEIGEDEDCAYLTYKLSRYPDGAWIGIDGQADTWVVERGHIENGVFIADEAHEVSGRSKFIQLLNSEYGDVQLWRIRTISGHMDNFGFTQNGTSGNLLYNQLQPCVEAVIHFPYYISLGSIRGMQTNTGYRSLVTIWMERIALSIATKLPVTAIHEQTFSNGYCLCEIDLSKMDTSQWTVFSSYYTFGNCFNLQYLDLSPLDLNGWSAYGGIRETFVNCYKLKKIKFGNWDTTNWVTNQLYAVFNGCYSLQELDLSWVNSSNWEINTMIDFVNNCKSLKRIIGFNDLDTANWPLGSLYRTFQDASNLEEVDMSRMDISNWSITDAAGCFSRCYSLKKIKLPTGLGGKSTRANGNIIPVECRLLTDYDGTDNGYSHNLSSNFSLSTTSLKNILINLPTVTAATTITLGSALLSKLTAEQIAVATQKGWTVA